MALLLAQPDVGMALMVVANLVVLPAILELRSRRG